MTLSGFVVLAYLIAIPWIPAAYRALRRLRVDQSDPSHFAAPYGRVRIATWTGRVSDVYKGSESYTSGTDVVTTTVVRKDQFMLHLPDGQVQSVQLEGFDVAVGDGHIVSAAAAYRRRDKTGTWFLIYDHTTNTFYAPWKQVSSAVTGWKVGCAGAAYLILLCLMVVTIPVPLARALGGRHQAKQFKNKGAQPLLRYLDGVAAGVPRAGSVGVDDLSGLAALKERGLLTDDEWDRAKQLYLGAPPDRRATALSHLDQIYRLYKEGALSESEFNGKKWEILSRESRLDSGGHLT